MPKFSHTIARVWGIPIRLHASLLIILLILPSGPYLLPALAFMVSMYTCIVLHELGHSYVALKRGGKVQEIMVLPIGGVAQMTHLPKKPVDELLMAIAGPAVSLLLAGVLYGIGRLFPVSPVPNPYLTGLPVRNTVTLLGILNVGWAVFNLTPAFPMDGGRVLRALLSHRLGRLRATTIAATAGKVIALLLGIIALREQLFILVIISLFVYFGASRELKMVRWQEQPRMAWFPFGFGPPPEQDPRDATTVEEDQIQVSPPPYKKGKGTRDTIRSIRGSKQSSRWKLFD